MELYSHNRYLYVHYMLKHHLCRQVMEGLFTLTNDMSDAQYRMYYHKGEVIEEMLDTIWHLK